MSTSEPIAALGAAGGKDEEKFAVLVRWRSFGFAFAAATVIVLLGAAPSAALYCNEPSEPWVPTPAWANQETMAKADADIQAYDAAVNDYVTCLQQAIEAVYAKRNQVIQQWTWTIDNLPQQ